MLQVPLTAVGRMFLKQPSLVTKSTALVAQRAAALAQLPGLGPGRAAAAVEAFPALLNLRPEVLQHRWSALQQVRQRAWACLSQRHDTMYFHLWRASLVAMHLYALSSGIGMYLHQGPGMILRLAGMTHNWVTPNMSWCALLGCWAYPFLGSSMPCQLPHDWTTK